MDFSKEDFIKNLQKEGSKKGYDQSSLNKAISKIKKDKIDLTQFNPHIENILNNSMKTANPTKLELQNRLRDTIKNKQMLRTTKRNITATAELEEEKQKKAEENKKADKIRAKRNEARKLRELSRKLGDISIETYNNAMKQVNNTELSSDDRAHYNNIIKLYNKQSKSVNINLDLEEVDISDL